MSSEVQLSSHEKTTELALKKKSINNLKMVFEYAFRSRKAFWFTIIFMSIGTVFNMVQPRIYGYAISGIEPDSPHPLATHQFIWVIIGGIGFSLVGAIFMGIGRYFSAEMGTMAQYYVRKDIYLAINRQTYSFFNENETGDLVSRATSDIETTQPVFNMGITASFQGILSLLGVSIAILLFKSYLSWIFFLMIIAYFCIIWYSVKKIREPYFQSREIFGSMTTVFRENIIGANVVRIFNSQNKEKQKFMKKNNEFRKLTIDAIKWSTILRYSGWIIFAVLIVGNFVYGSILTLHKELNIGEFVAILMYVSLMGQPIGMINRVVDNFIQADAAMGRVREVMESMPAIQERENAIEAININGHVRFDHVSFGYTSNLVLKDITFNVPAGETIAMLGTTGSGKSTLISLLPRFYDATSGTVFIDQQDVKNYNIKQLRQQIGFCSQDIFLFNKSIAENIKYGKEEATMEEVIDAAKSANIHDFIVHLPDSYDTLIGERGMSLSGGQKQRLAIARALIVQPKILILDDSTSSVDMETEYKIQEALERVMKNRTTFIITQRISTIRKAGKILVMDQGRVVGYDTHSNLFQSNPLYTQIFETLYAKQKNKEGN